jgi:hypothetical protein
MGGGKFLRGMAGIVLLLIAVGVPALVNFPQLNAMRAGIAIIAVVSVFFLWRDRKGDWRIAMAQDFERQQRLLLWGGLGLILGAVLWVAIFATIFVVSGIDSANSVMFVILPAALCLVAGGPMFLYWVILRLLR